MTVEFEDRLADLRRRFLLRAAGDRVALAELAAGLQQGLPVGAMAAELRPAAHKLAGAGGTLGFVGVSAAATELERRLEADTELSELAACCNALIREIDRAVEEAAGACGQAAEPSPAAASPPCPIPENGVGSEAISDTPV